jgi:TP901 family phage tail tape measure protein
LAAEQHKINNAKKIFNQLTREGLSPTKRHIQFLQEMAKEYKEVADMIRRAGVDLSKLQDIEKRRTTQDRLYEKFLNAFKAMRFDPKEFEHFWATLGARGTLKGSIPIGAGGITADTRVKLERLMDESVEFKRKMHGLFKQYGVDITATHNKLQSFIASTRNFMKFQIEWFAGAGLIFTVLGGIRQLVSESLRFEQALANIKAVTGATNKEVHLFAETAKEISQATPLAASEISSLAEILIRAGLSAEMTVEAMELAAKITTVSGEEAKVVAQTISTAVFAWQLGAKDMEKVGNALAGTLNYSRLEVEDLAEAFKYFGATARAFNKDFYETNALLASFSNLGFSASQIGTSLVQVLASLEAPTTKAREIMRSLGIDPIQLTAMREFADIVDELYEHGLSAAQAMEIMDRRGGRLFAAALAAGGDFFREMEKKIRESKQLTQGFEDAMSATINAWKRLWNQFIRMAIDVGNLVLPPLRLLINILTAITNQITHVVHAVTLGGNRLVAFGESVLAIMYIMRRFRREVVASELGVGAFQQWKKQSAALGGTVAASLNKGFWSRMARMWRSI